MILKEKAPGLMSGHPSAKHLGKETVGIPLFLTENRLRERGGASPVRPEPEHGCPPVALCKDHSSEWRRIMPRVTSPWPSLVQMRTLSPRKGMDPNRDHMVAEGPEPPSCPASWSGAVSLGPHGPTTPATPSQDHYNLAQQGLPRSGSSLRPGPTSQKQEAWGGGAAGRRLFLNANPLACLCLQGEQQNQITVTMADTH